MFGIDSSELIVIALVALLVIGPKDLPKAMRWVGQWAGKARAMSRHLRTGFDTMMREAELEEMQKLWAAQNEAIMKASALPENMLPDLAGPVPAADPWPPQPPDGSSSTGSSSAQSAAQSPAPAAPAALPAEHAAPQPAPRKPRARKPKPAQAAAPSGEGAA